MGQPLQLVKLGPFKAIDTTSADAYVAENVGTSGVGVNMHRVPLAIAAERGRVNIVQNSAEVAFVSPYVPAQTNEQIYGQSVSRFLYDFAAKFTTTLDYNGAPDTSPATQSVQVGNVLYDNCGRQYSYNNPAATYDWQYQPFTAVSGASGVTIGGLGVAASAMLVPSGAASGFYGVTLQFTFTRLTYGPNAAFAQESSAPQIMQGNNAAQFPAYCTYTFPVTGAIYYPEVTGAFTGMNDDGTSWVTNMYVYSNVVAVWYFAATLTGVAPYTTPYVVAMQTTSDFIANAQLTPTRDPPPVSPANIGSIAYHKGSTWCMVVQTVHIYPTQNATTSPQGIAIQQMQLWWSKYGIAWEFDSVNQVNVLDANVPPNSPPYSGAYGEEPVALVSLSSVLLAWTTKNTFVTYGDGTTQSPYVTRKLFNLGSRARSSFAVCVLDQVGSVCCWLSENGVQMTDGQYAYRIDEPIRSVINGLSLADRQNAVGFYARHAYYLSFPTLGQTYAYYLPTGDWFGPLPYGTSAAYAVPANTQTPLASTGEMNEVTAVRGTSGYIDSWFAGGDLDLGIGQTVTWNAPNSTCGEPRALKVIERVSVNAPVQPGITGSVTITTEQGSWTGQFDLSKGPTSVTTVGGSNGSPLVGFLVSVSVSLTTTGIGGVAQIWDVSVDGEFGEIAAFDNGAVT